MPALPPNTDSSRSRVLITGASGFVGQWVLRSLLDRGYFARVVIRSEEKAKAVKEWFPDDHEQLEFVIVEDMTKEGAFDEAVAGVNAIAHVATPFPSPNESAEDTIRIAQEATVSVLKSALKDGRDIKRVVITSTIGTIWTDEPRPRTFTEDDHNGVSQLTETVQKTDLTM